MTVFEFGAFIQLILVKLTEFWNMFSALTIAGIPWTRWLILLLGASIILNIVKHSFSDAGGVTVSGSVRTFNKGGE